MAWAAPYWKLGSCLLPTSVSCCTISISTTTNVAGNLQENSFFFYLMWVSSTCSTPSSCSHTNMGRRLKTSVKSMRKIEWEGETYPQPMTARKGLRRSTKHSDRQRRRKSVMANSAVHNRDEKTPHDSNTNCRYSFHVWLHSTTDHNSAPVMEEKGFHM